MDQYKVGCFIRDLRKERNMTQEQLAEQFSVSRRTVSRWETGINLPDIDLLVLLSEYFDVDLRDMIDGERKQKKMNEEMKETVLKVAEYSNADKKKMATITIVYFVLGIIALVINQSMSFMNLPSNFLVGLVEGMTAGMALAAMLLGILYTTGAMKKIRDYKFRMLGRK